MDVIVLFGVDDGEVDTPFSLIPSDHGIIVYTIRICVKGKNSPLQNGLLDEFLHPGFTWHPPAAFRLGWTRPLGNVLITNRTRTSAPRLPPLAVEKTIGRVVKWSTRPDASDPCFPIDKSTNGPLDFRGSWLSALGSRLCSPCPTRQTVTLRRGL